MCQTNIYLQRNGQETIVAENASFLEVTAEGVVIGTLFEEPKKLKGASIQRIDFLEGRVTLLVPPEGGHI
jgi:predicted RNA-binding protein